MLTIETDKFMRSVYSKLLMQRKPIIFACPSCLKVETFYILNPKVCSSCGGALPDVDKCAFSAGGRFEYYNDVEIDILS